MGTTRTPCSNCGLPYYTDRHSDCPYCEMASADGASETPARASTDGSSGPPTDSVARERPPERPRTTCSNCGLPHYADDGGGCPYCATAGVETGASRSDRTAAAGDPPDTGTSPATADERRSGGILGRLRSLFSL